MEIATLVPALISFLSPALPFLLKGGEGAAKEAGKKLGGETWALAQKIWGKLVNRIKVKPGAIESAHELAADPEDEELQIALRVHLKKLLEKDANLAQELNELLQQRPKQVSEGDSINQEIHGSNNVTFGKVSGGTINWNK